MKNLSPVQTAGREKTLLAAFLLSMWGPLATGLAVAMSSSTTQVADFVRRSVELGALFISWRVFRYLSRSGKVSPLRVARLERAAGLSVASALLIAGIVMLYLSLTRPAAFAPGGNVYPGLFIASCGLLVNSWFWRRYSRLNRENFSSIIEAQRYLYRAKAFIDFCVIIALSTVAIWPGHPVTGHIDLAGSLLVAAYLLWSGFRAARRSLEETAVT